MTTTEAPPVDLSIFAGKKIIVQVKLDEPNEKGESLIEIEGKAEAANVMGILIKPKGRTQVELIPAEKIEGEPVLVPEAAKTLKQKLIAVVEAGKVRQHLLDRHGFTLKQVNDLTEEQAATAHEAIDHTDLGHAHGEKQVAETQPDTESTEA